MVADISIVVVSNNEQKLNSLLLPSLVSQKGVKYELIIIDGNRFKSASSAYNEGAKKANCGYILFVHHDIVFTSDDALFKILEYKSLLNTSYAVLGVAGVYVDQEGEKHRLMTIKNGPEKKTWSYYELTEPQEVFSVDECAFFIIFNTILKYQFGDLGNTWHLYAVELCLHVKKEGHKVGVIPADLWHCSVGELNSDFFKRARILAQKYKKVFPVIYTTCITIDTTEFDWKYKLLKTEVKRKVLNT